MPADPATPAAVWEEIRRSRPDRPPRILMPWRYDARGAVRYALGNDHRGAVVSKGPRPRQWRASAPGEKCDPWAVYRTRREAIAAADRAAQAAGYILLSREDLR